MKSTRGGMIAAIVRLIVIAAVTLAGCDSLPGRPTEAEMPIRPTAVRDFAQLYGENCAGCHGADGKFGAAIPLNNPIYLALVDDAAMRRVISNGVPGTAMPPFAISAGGAMTDKQIGILAAGIRSRWAGNTSPTAGAPPYSATASGDAARGANVYAEYCASCHGADGTGGAKAGSIVDGSYLSLVSDQNLRTVIIAGRPDLGQPDWQNYVPGKPITADQVDDVVAWLAAKRPAVFARDR
jgi:cytochrome c oxidase cbb3-type subunit 3